MHVVWTWSGCGQSRSTRCVSRKSRRQAAVANSTRLQPGGDGGHQSEPALAGDSGVFWGLCRPLHGLDSMAKWQPLHGRIAANAGEIAAIS